MNFHEEWAWKLLITLGARKAVGVAVSESEVTDLSRARNGFRVGRRLPIAVVGRTYGLITVLERVEPDVRGDGVPATYDCRCARCGSIFTAKGSDVVHRRRRLCCQSRAASRRTW